MPDIGDTLDLNPHNVHQATYEDGFHNQPDPHPFSALFQFLQPVLYLIKSAFILLGNA